jgi:hypothetical protein
MKITDERGKKCCQTSTCSSGENLSAPIAHRAGPNENFVKGMDKTGRGFEYVRNKVAYVSDAKIKAGMFVGPQIRELMQDQTGQ